MAEVPPARTGAQLTARSTVPCQQLAAQPAHGLARIHTGQARFPMWRLFAIRKPCFRPPQLLKPLSMDTVLEARQTQPPSSSPSTDFGFPVHSYLSPVAFRCKNLDSRVACGHVPVITGWTYGEKWVEGGQAATCAYLGGKLWKEGNHTTSILANTHSSPNK